MEDDIEIDLNLLIGTDFERGLTTEEEEMILINSDHLETSPNVSDVTVRNGKQ